MAPPPAARGLAAARGGEIWVVERPRAALALALALALLAAGLAAAELSVRVDAEPTAVPAAARRARRELGLIEGAKLGQAARVAALLAREDSFRFVNLPDDGGETAAAWASFYGQDECLALLLANSANPSLGDRLGMTPLHWAAHEGRLNAARMLLDAGVDASAVDDKGDTPLAVARKNERLQVAELIEARGGVE